MLLVLTHKGIIATEILESGVTKGMLIMFRWRPKGER
jgi:hypothetical protein